uniref:C2H2-type domain-containing protein n=1 Tax=Anopheles albimanus TaxID=7167 RepID=A0A182F418_ANOAL
MHIEKKHFHTMLQHSKVHHGQRSIKKFACQHEDCHFLASSAADARRHLLAHSDERNFACGENGCEYRGKSAAQLRRYTLEQGQVGDAMKLPFNAKLHAFSSAY